MDADAQRKAAGERAAAMVEPGMVIGYGTGRGAAAALEALARRGIEVRGVPTSKRTEELCARLGLRMTTLEDDLELDLVIDGADEVDPQQQLLKGGGGALVREKLVALASKRRVIVVEQAKLVPRLGATHRLPIEVFRFGWRTAMARVERFLPGAVRRETDSDNGGVLLDAPLPAGTDLHALGRTLKEISGVINHGLFLDLQPAVIVGGPDGVRVIGG